MTLASLFPILFMSPRVQRGRAGGLLTTIVVATVVVGGASLIPSTGLQRTTRTTGRSAPRSTLP
jgi:hypothetical protein